LAEPGEWSDRFRNPVVWQRRGDLEQLAREAPVAELSPSLLSALATALAGKGAATVPLLRSAQQRYPNDFWLNFDLAHALLPARPEEAIGYYRAALALRPDTPAVHVSLGLALYRQGQLDEAIQHYTQAIALDPQLALAHANLGLALLARGDHTKAIGAF